MCSSATSGPTSHRAAATQAWCSSMASSSLLAPRRLPTKALAVREEAESHGEIRYVINIEHFVDHIFDNYYFPGAGPVVHHQGVPDSFKEVTPALASIDYAHDAIPTDDPRGRRPGARGVLRRPEPRQHRLHRPPHLSRSGTQLRTPAAVRPYSRTDRRCMCQRSGWFSPGTRSSPSARPG